ncbi:hypothetical protein EV193_101726 [Herbihabitans rhizosphaerae]|uniref:Subtilisin inhibitor-like n=1 Tax=Herbihabitans rhizosphaerae TaxID=1872711 RepID=A0A4Q7L6F8_9PSEU|nr:hypothetical protein [Herbihabitans rhizosphaerae]RZS44846.1 hypothetical protein EV193_101726 [Herbihabitans rhizosphaerae]
MVRLIRYASVLACCLLAAGCGGDDAPPYDSPSTLDGGNGGGSGGTTRGNQGKGPPGAPLNLDPAFQTGSPLDESSIRSELRRLCRAAGAKADCVKLEISFQSRTPGDCEIVRHSPTDVRVGGVVTFVVKNPCDTGGSGETTTTTRRTTTTTTTESE